MENYEKLGVFYLGRAIDPAVEEDRPAPLLYDSKDLVTHAVCVGMTGSGKTGLCLALLEEAAIDGIPAIVIDPKGDLANLLLTFPQLRGEDFLPWINADEAAKKGLSPEDFAQQQAEMWKKGLADWDQTGRAHPAPARRRRFRHLHARLERRAAGVDPALLRGAGARGARRRRAAAGTHHRHRLRAAGPGRHRGRSAQEPRAHPALDAPRPRLAAGTGPRPAGADPAGPEPAGGEGRRSRSGVLLPVQGPLRPGDGAQQPAGVAGFRRLDGRRAAGHRRHAAHPRRASRA